jgi:hypothetical protein
MSVLLLVWSWFIDFGSIRTGLGWIGIFLCGEDQIRNGLPIAESVKNEEKWFSVREKFEKVRTAELVEH